jgi:hypothetical protein
MANQSKYSSNPRQSLFRKILSGLFDGTIVTLFGAILSIIAVTSVLSSVPSFNESTDDIQTQVENIYGEYVSAKLAYFEADEHGVEVKTKLKDTTYVFERWIDKQISLSYSYDPTAFTEAGITIDTNLHPVASLENDEASYFFTTYNVEKNIKTDLYGAKTPLDYFKEEQLFKNVSQDNFLDEAGALPRLKTAKAIELYTAISKGEETDLYTKLSEGFDKINTNAFSLIRGYSVLIGYFDEYNAAYLSFAKIELGALLIIFAISFLLLIIGPQVFTPDHVTFGNLVTKTRRITSKGNNPSVGALVGRNVFALFRGALPFFIMGVVAFDFQVFLVPLFPIGSLMVNVLVAVVIALLVALLNSGFECFRKDHLSLEEIATRTELVTREMDFERKAEDGDVERGDQIGIDKESL